MKIIVKAKKSENSSKKMTNIVCKMGIFLKMAQNDSRIFLFLTIELKKTQIG
jgi:hypothetical protein